MSNIAEASESRQVLQEKKQTVLSLLDQTISFYSDNEEENNKEVLISLKENVENGTFNIVVVGEFSAGKSTLLNALMRKRILPSFTSETTATVNFLKHASKAENGEKGKVYYNDGTVISLEDDSLETISKYVSTTGENVASTIDHLDLYLDSDFLLDGVTLIDSPGLNGVADGHREITEKQILKSHASIFLFSSDHPGSKTDFDFVNDLQKKVNTIIFVLNKIDRINVDEGDSVESIIQTLKSNFKKKFPEIDSVPAFWPVSAFQALKGRTEGDDQLVEISRLNEFENRLLQFLTYGEKTKQELLAPVNRALTLLKTSKDNYEYELSLLEDKVDREELLKQMEAIQETIDTLTDQIANIRSEVNSNINEIQSDAIDKLNADLLKLKNNKIKEIEDYEDMAEAIDAIDSFESTYLSKACRIVYNCEDYLYDEVVKMTRMVYSKESSEIQSNLQNGDSNIAFQIDTHMLSKDYEIEIGIEKLREKEEALTKKKMELEGQLVKAEEDYFHHRKQERELTELKEELKDLKMQQRIVQERFIPDVETQYRKESTKVSRGGLFGAIGNVLFGKKTVERDVAYTDDQAQQGAIGRQQQDLQKYQKEIDKIKNVMEHFKDIDVEREEYKKIKIEREYYAVNAQLEAEVQKNVEELRKKEKRAVKKIKRDLSNYCDDLNDVIYNQSRKAIKEYNNTLVNTVLNVIEAKLQHELEGKSNKLNSLKNTLDQAENDKLARTEEINAKIARLNEILTNAIDIQCEISSGFSDEIEKEML